MSEAEGAARTTAVSFHTLADAGGSARLRHACLLTEQAFHAGERVLVWFDGADEMARFDDLLWSFGERSFVPHEPLPADPAACEAPVQLHAGALPADVAAAFGTLVMLRQQPAPEVLRFGRVIEVVDAEPACRSAGRARFRWYREQGVTPKHVEVTQ